MRPVVVAVCLLLAACGSGGSGGSPTTGEARAVQGTIDGLEVSSLVSASETRAPGRTYVVDAGPVRGRFAPTVREFTDDGRVRTIELPTDVPLIAVFSSWGGGGVTVAGIRCPSWDAGEKLRVDMSAPHWVADACGSTELVLLRWSDGVWSGPKKLFDAPSGYVVHSVTGTTAVLERLADPQSRLVDLRTGAIEDLPPTPEHVAEICLQSDGPVLMVDTGSTPAGDPWTARRLDGDAWGTAVDLPDGFVADCVDAGSLLVHDSSAAVVRIGADGSVHAADLGKPPGERVSYDAAIDLVAESGGRAFVDVGGAWRDVGAVPSGTFAYGIGPSVLLQPRAQPVEPDSERYEFGSVTMRLLPR